MKKINLSVLLFFTMIFSCKSQSVRNLEMEDYNFESGYYYKDINNRLNPFVGTWRFTNGNSILEINIQKKENYLFNSLNYSQDILLGEIKYIENGILKINRLPSFNINIFNGSVYNNFSLVGRYILPNTSAPFCEECSSFYKKIKIKFYDFNEPTLFFNSYIGLTDEPGNNQLVFSLFGVNSLVPDDDLPHDQTIPNGVYILTKLP